MLHLLFKDFTEFQKHYIWLERVRSACILEARHVTLEHADVLLALDREANPLEEPEPIQHKSMAKAMSPAMQQVHRLPAIAFASSLQPELLAPAALPHELGVGETVLDCLMQVMTVAACIGWMGISSALIMINKYIMSTDGFAYPMALSCLGMAFSSVASYLCCRVSHCACLTGARSLLRCIFLHDTWLQRIWISAPSALK